MPWVCLQWWKPRLKPLGSRQLQSRLEYKYQLPKIKLPGTHWLTNQPSDHQIKKGRNPLIGSYCYSRDRRITLRTCSTLIENSTSSAMHTISATDTIYAMTPSGTQSKHYCATIIMMLSSLARHARHIVAYSAPTRKAQSLSEVWTTCTAYLTCQLLLNLETSTVTPNMYEDIT